MSFRAAILERFNRPLVVSELTHYGTPGLGQVRVRVLMSGICGAQLQEVRGEKGPSSHLPHLLGHEGVCIVEEIGVGVTHVKKGDKCVMHWRKGAGLEGDFPKYIRYRRFPKWGHEEIGGGRVTTLTESAVISENRLTAIPLDTPNELAALLGCGLSSALGVIENEAKLKFGESILIVGAGGLGMNLIRCACLAHAHPIVATDIREDKRRLCRKLGATGFFDSSRQEVAGQFDCIVDTAGAGDSMEKTLPLLKPSGRYVMLGQPKPGRSVAITGARHMFEGEGKTIMATQGGGFIPHRDIPRYLALYKSGALKIDGIITKRLPLSRINEGFEMVGRGNAGRVMIDMEAK